MGFRHFAPITKVDVAKRQIHVRAAEEAPDKSNEVFDYATSKPEVEKWSNAIADATTSAGQEPSFGNIRVMHGKQAVGKFAEPLIYDDATKTIDGVIEVTHDQEWNDVLKGVLTGVSIGGDYLKKWKDQANGALTRYTAKPSEFSLVDNPCMYGAHFSMVKAAGITEEATFLPANSPLRKIEARTDADPKEGADKYGDVKFADETNKKYPIDTEAHIRAAWNYIHKQKNADKYKDDPGAVDKIKSKIEAAWKEKISSDGPPSAEEAEKAAPVVLRKDMYGVSSLADILTSLQYLTESAFYEAEWEQDASIMPEQLVNWLRDGIEILKDMTAEEAGELLDRVANKSTEAKALRKAGARNSRSDQKHLDEAHDAAVAMHDHTVAMGADCDCDKGDDDAEKATRAGLLAKSVQASTALAKLEGEKAALQKRVDELEAMPNPPKGVLLDITKTADDQPNNRGDAKLSKLDADIALIKGLAEKESDPHTRQVLNGQVALLEIRRVQSQPPTGAPLTIRSA